MDIIIRFFVTVSMIFCVKRIVLKIADKKTPRVRREVYSLFKERSWLDWVSFVLRLRFLFKGF